MTEIGPTYCDVCKKQKPSITSGEDRSWFTICPWGERNIDCCSMTCLQTWVGDRVEKEKK